MPTAWIRFGTVPTLALGVNGLALAVVTSGASPAWTTAAILGLAALALGLSFAAEHALPYQRDWNRDRGDARRDLAHFVVNESLSLGPLLAVPLLVTTVPEPPSRLWPSAWPAPLQALFAIAVFDLGQTLFHWASHTWRPLWRLHAVHHEVQRMYGLNGILKHPLYQGLASVVSLAPLALLGMPDAYALFIAFASFVQLLIQHSNVDFRTGPFRRVFASAEVHRFHHLRGAAGDVNFALFFAFWDELFGNAHREERKLTSDDIGLEDRRYPVSWWGQLRAPFRTW